MNFINGFQFYKGFYLIQVRKQGDNSMFSRVVGWRAYKTSNPKGDEDIVCQYRTKAEVKKFITILQADFTIR